MKFGNYLRFSSFSTTKNKHNVLFFGTDAISERVLEGLHKNKKNEFKTPVIERLEVVSTPDTPGKKNIAPIKRFCLERGIAFHQPLSRNKTNINTEWEAFYKELLMIPNTSEKDKFDLGIICSFGYMIPDFVIDYFPKGIYVIHPSLLPKYRGSSPIQYTLINGDQEAGISIIETSKGAFDKGKILIQDKLPVHPKARYVDLANELALLGGMRSIDLLENLSYFRENAKPQDEVSHNNHILAKKFKAEDTIVHWEKWTNHEVFNRFRAFYGTGFKAIRTKFNDTWLFIEDMDTIESESEEEKLLRNYENAIPGSIWLLPNKKYKNNIYVKCKKEWIVIYGWYLEGKTSQPSHKFINQFIERSRIADDPYSEFHYSFNCTHKKK